VVSRTFAPALAAPRVIAPPRVGKGDVTLRVCDVPGRLTERRISRHDKLDYKAAKKLGWGDIVRDTGEQAP
jgi:ribosomal protein RSM22 (predicted rRNA methylase)